MIYAKRDPKGFLNILRDPMLKLQANIHVFFENKLLAFRNNNKEVWFNTPSNKKKMCNIPFGEDPMYIMTSFFQSDDGLEVFKQLKALAKNS